MNELRLLSWRIPTTSGECWPGPSVLLSDVDGAVTETASAAPASHFFVGPDHVAAGDDTLDGATRDAFDFDNLVTGGWRPISHSIVIDDHGPILSVLFTGRRD